MTEPFRLHGTLEFKTPKKADAALGTYRQRAWDFATDAFRIEGATITADFTSEVPSDGYELFHEAFVALAKDASSGALTLDWYPDVATTSTPANSPSLQQRLDPRNGTRQRIYPKGRSVICARTEPHPLDQLSRYELTIALLRHPKYRQRFYELGALVGGVLLAANDTLGAAVLDFSEKLFDEVDTAYGIVLYDAQSRELDRIFPGKLLTIELALSPDGRRLAAATCSGKKRPKKLDKPRAGECVLIWDLENRSEKPTKLEVEHATALPRSAAMARLLGDVPTRTLLWDDDRTLRAARATGGFSTWTV
ncbi:MAG: hypothetical protein H6723_19035 [Sandaracinus sp.]|nr:hypothetical protein [Sandaracinus sp.]